MSEENTRRIKHLRSARVQGHKAPREGLSKAEMREQLAQAAVNTLTPAELRLRLYAKHGKTEPT